MSVYQVKFNFMDGKDLAVQMKKDDLANFFSHLNDKQVYWNEAFSKGFWTDLDRVRWIEFNELQTPKVEKVVGDECNTAKDNCEEISEEALGAAEIEEVVAGSGASASRRVFTGTKPRA